MAKPDGRETRVGSHADHAGVGSIPGAILGGLILGLIDSIVATALGAEPAFLLSFVFIIMLLLFRPTGLFGYAS